MEKTSKLIAIIILSVVGFVKVPKAICRKKVNKF